MEYKYLIYSVSERILTLTLNRPDQLNTINPEFVVEIIDALKRADKDDEIKAVIITGAGKAFSAGSDLSGGATSFEKGSADDAADSESYRDAAGRIALPVYDMKKPVIAAINGAAVGMGITMILPADIKIASDNARFGFVFARRGIVAEGACSWFLPRIVGISKALEWIASGRIIKVQEALSAGLINEIVPLQELMPRAREIALDIAVNTSAVSVALNRRLLWKMLGCNSPLEAHLLDSKLAYWSYRQSDVREGVESFAQKRAPDFKMKPSTDMPDFIDWFKD